MESWRPPEPSASIIQHSGRRRPARRQAVANEGVAEPAGGNPENGAEPIVAAGSGGAKQAVEKNPQDHLAPIFWNPYKTRLQPNDKK